MKNVIKIGNRKIGAGQPTYIVAEFSANHHQDLQTAIRLVRAAQKAGADAIKIQTYTADTITLNCRNKYFQINGGTLWDGRTLYDLYSEAYTPWEWHAPLQKKAKDLGLDFFSSPFDPSAVDFLEKLKVRAYKVASFEIVDLPLIEKVARTKKPIIFSTGMATYKEIRDAVKTAQNAGATQIALLKCTSAYPAPYEEMHLRTIENMRKKFNLPIGLSDHTLGIAIPVAAVALGACIVEKHFVLDRKTKGPDSVFSLTPDEFSTMVENIRKTEKALGKVQYGAEKHEKPSLAFRRSLFIAGPVRRGEKFSERNIRSVRPANGLAPKFLKQVLGKTAVKNLEKGTPLKWAHLKK
ncbi:MAG: N-acylneuraminate-9-phosphate synthase [Parcubacteria group bacterium GW2011_GWF2_45_11]|nr:MAG: N-acylneuraminate-9-phosphate synthase [Parcubacteria group bacterium GW2011_GWF2_45_11]OGW69899.1 MAG: pseudaminic acid synthase [Omnitrophica bacterium GWA2_50_21]